MFGAHGRNGLDRPRGFSAEFFLVKFLAFSNTREILVVAERMNWIGLDSGVISTDECLDVVGGRADVFSWEFGLGRE